jgi:hypothetical protein
MDLYTDKGICFVNYTTYFVDLADRTLSWTMTTLEVGHQRAGAFSTSVIFIRLKIRAKCVPLFNAVIVSNQVTIFTYLLCVQLR